MVRDKELVQRLNLLTMSKQFVLHETASDGSADVVTKPMIPANDGVYWVAGQTVLKNGTQLDSVFRVDTDTGGTLMATFWNVEGKWYDQQDAECISVLGGEKNALFPYDWSYAVSLEEDIYHD